MFDSSYIWNTSEREHAITVELNGYFAGEFRYMRTTFSETLLLVHIRVNNQIGDQPVLVVRIIRKTSVVFFNL